MAKKKETFQKRSREIKKRQKREKKMARKLEAKERRAQTPSKNDGVDPDIIEIKPGPQPLPDQWDLTRGVSDVPE